MVCRNWLEKDAFCIKIKSFSKPIQLSPREPVPLLLRSLNSFCSSLCLRWILSSNPPTPTIIFICLLVNSWMSNCLPFPNNKPHLGVNKLPCLILQRVYRMLINNFRVTSKYFSSLSLPSFLPTYSWRPLTSLHKPRWLQTLRAPSASSSQVLRLTVCTTTIDQIIKS